MESGKNNLNGTLPWTKSCLVCGENNKRGFRLKLRVANGEVLLDYTVGNDDLGWKTALHGGVTMTLLDEAMTWAAIVESGHACVSAEITVRMKTPIPVGSKIHISARVSSNQRRILFTEGEARFPDGTVAATASGKYMQMKGQKYDICATDFVRSPSAIDPAAILGKA